MSDYLIQNLKLLAMVIKTKDKRQKLEEVAITAVQHGGLKSLSFRTLADEVGIKSSSVHYHFPEKSHLAKALIERYSEEFFRNLKEIEIKKWGLRRKLKAFIDIFETVADQDKLCLCGMMASEVEQLNEENRQLLNNYFVNTENWLFKLFNENQSEVKSDLGSRTLARSVLAGLEGALLLDRVVGDKQRLKAQRDLIMSHAT